MTVFALIHAAERRIEFRDFPNYKLALAAIDLKSGQIDFGTLGEQYEDRVLSVIVYEYSLFSEPEEAYWAWDRQLFNGNAVIYACDVEGETVDIRESDLDSNPWFLGSVDSVEAAIGRNLVRRPQSSVNGIITWRWNGQRRKV